MLSLYSLSINQAGPMRNSCCCYHSIILCACLICEFITKSVRSLKFHCLTLFAMKQKLDIGKWSHAIPWAIRGNTKIKVLLTFMKTRLTAKPNSLGDLWDQFSIIAWVTSHVLLGHPLVWFQMSNVNKHFFTHWEKNCAKIPAISEFPPDTTNMSRETQTSWVNEATFRTKTQGHYCTWQQLTEAPTSTHSDNPEVWPLGDESARTLDLRCM